MINYKKVTKFDYHGYNKYNLNLKRKGKKPLVHSKLLSKSFTLNSAISNICVKFNLSYNHFGLCKIIFGILKVQKKKILPIYEAG